MRRLLLIALLFAAQNAAAKPAQVKATEQPKAQLNKTLETLAKTKEEQSEIQQKLDSVQKEFEALQDESTTLAERLQISERRVSREERALGDVNGRLAQKQKEFEARKQDYAATIATLLRMRELPATAIFAQGDDVERLVRTASVLEKTNHAAAQKANALAHDMEELRALKTESSTRRTRTLSETQTLTSAQSALEKALDSRQKLQAKLLQDNARTQQKIAKLSRESASLQGLIEKLDQEAAKEKKTEPKQKPTRAFEGKKGSLRAPVSGEVLHRFGERKSANETYRGMVFRARSGATVVAPYDGQVVFTGPFRDYGNILLIKHGNGYISLIAGVGKITASLNQRVIRGEPVAVMSDRDNAEAYVELRDSTAKPIDPGDWFANVTESLTQK